MEWVWPVALVFLGVMMLVKPELLWRIEHVFTVKGGEPTQAYLAFMRIGGVVFIAAAIICTIAALL